MTEPLFRGDAYLRQAAATVIAINDRGGIVLDRSLFYPTGGGQPGDAGALAFGGQEIEIVTAVKGQGDEIILVPAEGSQVPQIGTPVTQSLDWDKRLKHMRIHTALHLLSVVIPLPVTGGQITAQKGRLDFDMPETLEDKQAVEDAMNALIARDLQVSEDWITDAELAANPGLVKTMSVQPPKGAGRVRLVRIGTPDEQVDLQPCGGTHVKRTSEIGRVALGKVQKKGRRNRRVSIALAE